MDTVISLSAGIGFNILKNYFIERLESEDLTHKQIVDLFQDNIDKVQKDLQVLKLQKLRSATYLFKCGVSMFEEGDLKEAQKNFDKAESDAIEGFSTAPDFSWKVLATKISVSSHMWRKLILVRTPNIDAVIRQILLHIQRLADDEIIKSNVKTHLDQGFSVMRKIHEDKRKDIIRTFVSLHQSCKQILFSNFLEILPSVDIEFKPGILVKSTSLAVPYSLGSTQNELVPYSPNQCKAAVTSPPISSWENVRVDCKDGLVTMLAHGKGEDMKTVLYKCFRMSYELPGNINPVKKWFIFPVEHSTAFDVMFISLGVKYAVAKTSVTVNAIVNERTFSISPDYRDASHIGCWIDLHEEFFRHHDVINFVNEGADKIIIEISVSELVNIASVTLSLHLKRNGVTYKGISGLSNLQL